MLSKDVPSFTATVTSLPLRAVFKPRSALVCGVRACCSSAKRENFNHFSVMSLKLQEYHSYRSLVPCKKITRKSTLECTFCYDEYITRASLSNTGTRRFYPTLSHCESIWQSICSSGSTPSSGVACRSNSEMSLPFVRNSNVDCVGVQEETITLSTYLFCLFHHLKLLTQTQNTQVRD